MINVNDFSMATDSETLEKAFANKQADGIVLIPPRKSFVDPDRTFWLLDRAILLEENTTVILQNATIKLSDACRDNFFRTANCGMGIEFPERIQNVHLIGEGMCTLIGADHPRSTGDGSKILANPCPYEVEELCRMANWIPPERRTPETIGFMDRHDHSFGTDAGTDESQYGDWRNIGVLFANVEHFSIRNLRIVASHGWGISLEECAYGDVGKIEFDACMSKVIDGLRNNIENQDGIDLRNGCHHITVADIRGETGDDVIALTAIALEDYRPGGALRNTHVMHNDWTRRERDIHDIIIRNVSATSNLCFDVRLLPMHSYIYNILIDGVLDTTPADRTHGGTLLLGDWGYGDVWPKSMKNILVSNIISNCDCAIAVNSDICHSAFSNVINRRSGTPLLTVNNNALFDVKTANLVQEE